MSAIGGMTKGSNIVLEWTRPAKTFKTCAETVEKHVRMVGRMGLDYNNLQAVQEKRESGELPSDPQPLPWGVWAIFPWLIEHKGTHYVRLYKGTSAKVRPSVSWTLNGKPVEYAIVEPLLLASEKGEERESDCFTCKTENMTRIASEESYA